MLVRRAYLPEYGDKVSYTNTTLIIRRVRYIHVLWSTVSPCKVTLQSQTRTRMAWLTCSICEWGLHGRLPRLLGIILIMEL